METNPLRAFAEMWARIFEISGRTRRAAYWGAMILNFAAGFVLGFLPYAGWIYSILSIIPGITMSVRRMHDTGRSGLWLLAALIPLGGILVFVLLLLDSDGANHYGDSPKYGKVPF